jgi:dTDP-4-amino-4,6-dideoxygalactose transaminase
MQVLVPSLPKADELLPFLRRIDASHWYSNYGPLWQEFRDAMRTRIAANTGASDLDVAFTSSGTTAIELALRVRAIAGRRLCLMPSYTFIASAHAVCNVGLEPFLLDIDEHSLTLTPEIAEQALSTLPEPPAAVLVISAYGAPPDIRGWERFEATHGIPVVYDAAAALMSLNAAGHQPICVSLHATKVLGIGEGGAVLSTDAGTINRITAMTGFGFVGAARVADIRGGNYRISEYAAAVGLAALAGIDAKVAKLRHVTQTYIEHLRNSPIRLQDGAGDEWVSMTLNVRLPPGTEEATLARLDAAGVPWRRWWGLGCHSHPAFRDLPSTALPITHDLAPRVIGVPCHTELTEDDIAQVCALLTA